MLEPLYEASQQWSELCAILELQAEDSDDPDSRVGLLRRIGELRQNRLTDIVGAFDAWARAIRIRFEEEFQLQLETLADVSDDFESLVKVYDELLASVYEHELMLSLRLRLAELCRDRLSDPARAEAYYLSALEVEESNPVALLALESLYTIRSAWPELMGILERQIENQLDPEIRRNLILRVAQLQEEMLEDAEGAISSYLRVLDAEPSDIDAISALKRLYRAGERWIDLVDLLQREMDIASSSDALLAIKYELGRVYQVELSEYQQAVDTFQHLLELDGSHEGSIEALEQMFEADQERLAVAQVLEPIYRTLGEWNKLVIALEARLTETSDEYDRGEQLKEILSIWEEQIGDQAQAFGVACRLFGERPAASEAQQELKRLALALGAIETWAEHYQQALDGDKLYDFADRMPLLLELAEIHAERLRQHERAREIYQQVLTEDPACEQALDRLEWSYNQLGEWEALVSFYNMRFDVCVEPDERVAILLKAATIQEDVLHDVAAAIGSYQRILLNDPEDERALRALERAYRQTSQFEALAELYRREMDFATDTEAQVELFHRLGLLLEKQLERVAEALDAYRSVLDLNPKYEPTRRALEALLRELAQREGEERELRLEIALLLEPLYSESEWTKRIAVYEVQLEHIDDVFGRVEIMVKQAKLYEHFDADKSHAFEAYARAFESNPSDRLVRAELERLTNEREAWSELVTILLRGIENCEDDIELVQILQRIAEINEQQLGDANSAILCHKQILEHDPSNAAAVEALERLYQSGEHYEELVQILAVKASNLNDIWERKDLYYRIADFWEKHLDVPAEAIATYQTILDIDDEDHTALDALERLYQRTENWAALVDVFRRKVDLSASAEMRLRYQYALAALYDEQLADPHEAIEAYRTVLAENPGDPTAIPALDRLFEGQEQWVDLLEVLELELELANQAGDAELINFVAFRMASLLETKLDDVVRAIELYRSVLEREPSHEESFARLEHLLADPAHRRDVMPVLEPLYEALESWERLLALYEMKLEGLSDLYDRRELMRLMAAIFEQRLAQPQRSFELLARAFAENPSDEVVLAEYERLTAALEAWEAFAASLQALIAETTDPDLLRDLCLRAASAVEQRLGKVDEAIALYGRVIELDEYHPEALANLDRLYQQTEQWKELAEVLERRITLGAEREQMLTFRFQLGYLKEHIFEDLPAAIENYKQILWEDAEHGEALVSLERIGENLEQRLVVAEILEPIYSSKQQWEKLRDLLRSRLEVIEDVSEKTAMLARIATLSRDELAQPERAFEALAEALELEPFNENTIAELEGLCEQLGNDAQLAASLDKASAALDDEFLARNLHLKVGALYLERLGEHAAAERKYRQVLESDESNNEALERLEAIYVATSQAASLLEIFDLRIHFCDDPFSRKAWLYRAAEIALNTVRDDTRGIAYLESVLELDAAENDALLALTELYQSKEKWPELVRVLEQRANASMDAAELFQLRLRIGEVARHKLGDRERALEAYRNALDFEPSNRKLLDTLEEILVEAEQWSDVRDILMRQLSLAEEPDDRILMHMKLAAIAADKFQESERAIENLRQILELDPSHEEALGELESLYAAEGRYADLLAVLEQQKELASSAEEQISLNIRIAQVAGTHLNNRAMAIASLQEVLRIQPSNVKAIAVLASLFEQQADYGAALDLLNDQYEYTTEKRERAAVLVHIAQILQGPGKDPTQAEHAYVRALHDDATNLDAIDALLGLYQAAGEHAKRLRILELKVATVASIEEKKSILLSIAETAREELADFATAARALETVYQTNTEDLEMAELLLDAYIKSDELAKAQPLLDGIIEQLDAAKQNKRLPPFYHMRGQLALKAGDREAALASFKSAHAINATYMPNLFDLGRLYFEQEDWQEAMKYFQNMLLNQMNIKEKSMKVEVFYYLGMVRVKTDDPRRARDMFTRALSIEPNHAPSKEALGQL
ncbi:MAG: tetratricopeptide repeat protein [Myxococcota bacterium]|nr:tetratricopeptide repeat protein [Myxococcota bacterium]